MSSININDLNEDCFKLILKYLPFKQIIRLRGVSNKWKQLIEIYLSEKQHLEISEGVLRIFNFRKTEKFITQIPQLLSFMPNLLTINVSFPDPNTYDCDDDEGYVRNLRYSYLHSTLIPLSDKYKYIFNRIKSIAKPTVRVTSDAYRC